MAEFMDLKIESRSGKVVIESLRISTSATTEDLKQAIFDEKDRKGKYSPVRQRLTLPPAPGAKAGSALGDGQSLTSYGLQNGAVVQYKDLGMQVSYKLVFFVEYLGPLLIYPFFWTNAGRSMLHGVTRETHPTTLTQDLALFYWSFHYAKRIFETGNVHVFSHATMPIFNLFRNSSYYWLFAAFVSYNMNHPRYTDPWFWQTAVCLFLAYCCQVGNFYSHVKLASLRKSSTGYSIPRGGLFNVVTCANYTYEIWGWVLFTLATQSLPAAIFGACGAFQMVQWAIAKHKRLKKLFDGQEGREKYPRRYVILPPLL